MQFNIQDNQKNLCFNEQFVVGSQIAHLTKFWLENVVFACFKTLQTFWKLYMHKNIKNITKYALFTVCIFLYLFIVLEAYPNSDAFKSEIHYWETFISGSICVIFMLKQSIHSNKMCVKNFKRCFLLSFVHFGVASIATYFHQKGRCNHFHL